MNREKASFKAMNSYQTSNTSIQSTYPVFRAVSLVADYYSYRDSFISEAYFVLFDYVPFPNLE